MQILPTSNSSLGFVTQDTLPGAVKSGFSADMFAGLLNSYKQSNSSAVMDALNKPLPKVDTFSEPETRTESAHSMDGDTMRDVRMTRDDIMQIAPKLEAAGVPKEKLEELANKADSQTGVTWGQFTHEVEQSAVSKSVKKEELSDQDRQTLMSMFGHLGFSDAKAKELTDALANGQTGHVWRQVSAQLSQQEPGTVSKDEMAALAKALRLPDDARNRLASLGAATQGQELSGNTLKQIFGEVQKEVGKQVHQAEQDLAPVRQVLDQALAKAKEQAAGTAKAEADKAQPTGVRASSLLQDVKDHGAGRDDSSKVAASANNAKGQNVQQPGAPAPGTQTSGQQGGQSSGKQTGQDGKAANDHLMADMGGKVRADGDTRQSATATPFGLGQQGPVANALSQARSGDAQATRTQASQVMEQIDSGVFKNLGQGMKQLSLELTPEALGKLNVVLTVKGKEVQAVIKAETPEAEKAIAENLQQLKQKLEDQGLTVAKLEVRQQTPDASMNQQWAGSDKHNETQQRRDALERLRTSALLSSGGESLAQQMQNSGAEAKITQRGLDIVA